jgi:hypothetical protein
MMQLKNKRIVLVIAAIGVFAVIFLLAGSGGEKTILSDDGSATLVVSRDALPQGVRMEDIQVKRLAYDAVPAKPDADDFIAAYEFQPDGLVFKKPVKVSFVLKNIDGASVPVAAMVSNGEAEVIAKQRVEIDGPGKSVVITGEVAHFSYSVIARSFFEVKLTDPGDHFVGESFDVEGITKVEKRTYTFSSDASQVTTHTLMIHPNVSGMVTARLPRRSDLATAVSPVSITAFPAVGTQIPERGELRSVGTFTCVEAGDVELGYVVQINKGGYEWRKRIIPDPSIKNWNREDDVEQREFFIDIAYSSDPFACRARPVVTPSSTPSSTQTAVKIQVIQYSGKYLPVDQLIIENEAGCGAEHYHAERGVVKATDGSMIPDPGPQCGYGKVSEKPVMEVLKP